MSLRKLHLNQILFVALSELLAYIWLDVGLLSVAELLVYLNRMVSWHRP